MSRIAWDVAVSKRTADRWPRRVFLKASELKVFETWGVPVRYVRKGWRTKLGNRCTFRGCGKPADEAAHVIPYQDGVLLYDLTPSYLMRWENLAASCSDHNEDLRWSESRIRKHIDKLRRTVGSRR